jgi:hypothetical protein
MIVIQILLITGVVTISAWLLLRPKSHQVRASIKLLGLLFSVLAIVVIVSPNTSNRLAHVVGVGRGADLLLYALTLAFIFVVLYMYIRSKEEQDQRVILARKIALLEAKINQLSRESDGERDGQSSPTP